MAAIKDGREYRIITRAFQPVDDGNEGDCIVEGYATTFDVPYDFGIGGEKECIRKSALEGADLSDIIFLYNHDGLVLARQRNGSLSVDIDDKGLFMRANLNGTPTGRELYEAIKRGLIDKMSWAFAVPNDGWDYDSAARTSYVTRIAKVYDVSAVSRPADEDTIINARSYFDGVIEAERQRMARVSEGQTERSGRNRKYLAYKLKGVLG
jgi:HK97 family phage prohead protease